MLNPVLVQCECICFYLYEWFYVFQLILFPTFCPLSIIAAMFAAVCTLSLLLLSAHYHMMDGDIFIITGNGFIQTKNSIGPLKTKHLNTIRFCVKIYMNISIRKRRT